MYQFITDLLFLTQVRLLFLLIYIYYLVCETLLLCHSFSKNLICPLIPLAYEKRQLTDVI
jgi:hypothetical protein